MSFLNPVNEPVLRFSSTDADAPQIDYNSRTSGDIKTVLKACMATGYGAKASAGWSIVNETTNDAEFISPSAAMSSYRIGLAGGSYRTTWYYMHNDVKKTPSHGPVLQEMPSINKTHASNGWELLVTPRGFILVEKVYSTVAQSLVAHATYFSLVKSNINIGDVDIMAFWSAGWRTSLSARAFFLSVDVSGDIKVASWSPLKFDFINKSVLSSSVVWYSGTASVASLLYIFSESRFLAALPAVLICDNNGVTDVLGVRDGSINSRAVLHISLCDAGATRKDIDSTVVRLAIPLDYWEY